MSALTKIKIFTRQQNPVEDRILLIPGNLFFVESVPLPDGLDEAEAESLAQLTLESITPFPMEQLHWGFVIDRGQNHLLIYAAYQERLRKAGFQRLEDYRQVFPDFLCLDNVKSTAPATHLLRGESCWVAAVFPAGARYPVTLQAAEVAVEPTIDVAEQSPGPASTPDTPSAPENESTLNELLSAIDESQFPVGNTVDGPASAGANESGQIRFFAGENQQPLATLQEREIWSADLRDRQFGHRIEAQRTREQWIWRGMIAAAVFALLLLASDIARWSLNRVADGREREISRRAEAVAQIAGRNDLVNRLETRSLGRLRPFQTLEIINQSRPGTVYFTDLEAGEANRFTIDGIASNPNEVNEYAQSLRDLGYFDSVIQENRRVVSGQVNFTLTLVVNELPATQAIGGLPEDREPSS